MSDDQQSGRKIRRKTVAAAGSAQLLIGFLTLRDINRRGKEGVRGPRVLWKVWGGTNTLGSLLYWKFGRRKP